MAKVWLGVLFGVLVGAGLVSSPAAAHEDLVFSDPQQSARLSEPPRQVSLTFSATLDARLCQVVVTDAAGAVVAGELSVSGPTATRSVAIEAAGEYTIAYRVVSGDGHPVSGTVLFTVVAPLAASTTSTPEAGPADVAAPSGTVGATADLAQPGGTGSGPAPWAVAAGAVLVAVVGGGWWWRAQRARDRRVRP